jgi:hypothetical protein
MLDVRLVNALKTFGGDQFHDPSELGAMFGRKRFDFASHKVVEINDAPNQSTSYMM